MKRVEWKITILAHAKTFVQYKKWEPGAGVAGNGVPLKKTLTAINSSKKVKFDFERTMRYLSGLGSIAPRGTCPKLLYTGVDLDR